MKGILFPFKKIRRNRRLKEDLALIGSSGLFDEAWYLANNPVVADAKVDPLLHYLNDGGFEGRNPSPKFSSAWYLNNYGDVKQAGINPLVHYLKYGKKEGRRTQPPQIHSQQNEAETTSNEGIDDLSLIRASGLFDEAWYLANNPDVADAKVDPIHHYLQNGGFEGRDPSPKFSSARYLNSYEDVKQAGINPLVHYLKYGQEEGRRIFKYGEGKAKNFYNVKISLDEKVFCISMQRTGTTSVGKFFRDFGFRWAGWPADKKNNWAQLWYDGNFEKIFSSTDFKLANAYEDSPWFYPDFYKILFFRFPNAKFILFTRNPHDWFQSMINHSNGDVIGGTRKHCKIYRREMEYFELLKSGTIDENIENQIESKKKMKIVGHQEHYIDIYRLHNIEVEDFFSRHAPASLHIGRLEDPNKWKKLGDFLNVELPEGYDSHENASTHIGK